MMFKKFQAIAAVAAANAMLAGNAVAQDGLGGCQTGFGAATAASGTGAGFYNAVLKFIGSPVFYFVMFLLAISGLYSAIVKQDTSGWYAVGFAAIGAAMPNIFKTIANFGCNVATSFAN